MTSIEEQTLQALRDILDELRKANLARVQDDFLTVSQAAEYCHVSGRTILNWRNRGWVHTAKRGGTKGVMRSELDRMLVSKG